MRELIRKCLLEAWSSTLKGIDIDKAVELLYTKELKLVDTITDECEHSITLYEKDLENSTKLLIELRDEILILKDISSNNPNRLLKLNDFLDRINKQIAKNEQ